MDGLEAPVIEDIRQTLMDISVVIVNYNVSSFLDQALLTLKDAIKDIEAEVFVVDNASTDDSTGMVRKKYPWVNLIENEKNVGFARGNNIALRRVTGKYILLLNPDTVLRRNTISIMKTFLEEHQDAGLAGCKVINPDGTLQLACRRGFPTPGGAFFKLSGLSGLFPNSKTFGAYNLTYLDPDTVSEVDAVSGSFMIMRREVIEKIGYLDEDFFMYGEDLDFCYRVKEAGWNIYYVPTTEIIHFKGESTKTIPSVKSNRDFYQAMHIFVKKHYAGRKIFPKWILTAGIYLKMGAVCGAAAVMKIRQPIIDLTLLNISLFLSIILRFGIHFENVPAYTQMEWISLFTVYSALYMVTFFFLGVYHRYRNNPERALVGIFIGFLFHIFIINFINEYNFSRIASFYCWGFNIIFISGWRFLRELYVSKYSAHSGSRAIVVGTIEDAVALRQLLSHEGVKRFDIIGCVETRTDVLRGKAYEGLHVLGLVNELSAIVREYEIGTVIMVGTDQPFSQVLMNSGGYGIMNPDFKFIPELPSPESVKNKDTHISLIDINPGGTLGF